MHTSSPPLEHSAARPIVFLGPSLSQGDAARILDADYRPPIKRGDLEDIDPGQIVAIIDGVFDQHLAVTPTEIRQALARGVRIFGASSMGALRAVEVPGVIGIGRIYAMYRDGQIDRDDEVAIMFDSDSLEALSQPLVNVRHALTRLSDTGTLSRRHAKRILRAAQGIPYFERAYPRILERAGLAGAIDAAHLTSMLASHNLKRDDAILLLERLRNEPRVASVSDSAARIGPHHDSGIALTSNVSEGMVHVWEFGPPITFRAVVCFLAVTGALRPYALRALASVEHASIDDTLIADGPSLQALADGQVARVAHTWNWMTDEELTLSLRQLGISDEDLAETLTRRALKELQAMTLLRRRDPSFLRALRSELFFDELELKRLAARAVSLRWLADHQSRTRAVVAEEIAFARESLCRMVNARDFNVAVLQLGYWGIAEEEIEDFVEDLALAQCRPTPPSARTRRMRRARLERSDKIPGSLRFCMSAAQAQKVTERLQKAVGITRLSIITGLGTIGIPNAQAFRPDGQWSSTVGSGKSETVAGARIGAVMEEVEKWAQERYSAEVGRHIVGHSATFADLQRKRVAAVDPASLDLPWDTQYRADLALSWVNTLDLTSGKPCLIPAAAVTNVRLAQDIYYSAFGARKTVTTNGLASGMSLAEALTHALCECIERHERALDAIVNDNPGGPWIVRRPVVDLDHAPRSTQRILRKITRAGYRVVARALMSDIAVPTFIATILRPEGPPDGESYGDGWQQASGWAAHPDPETALNMALLEASQTILSHIAGAREDLTLAARSLGRHERTESRRLAHTVPEFDRGARRIRFDVVAGFRSNEAAKDVGWIVSRLISAGFGQVLMVDYSRPEIAPARVVRCLVPGVETINPFYTGPTARKALLADLLSRA